MPEKNKNAWTQSDYSSLATEAAHRVLVEIPRVLGAYSKRFVLIGGSVPPLLLPNAADHVGTTDIDLAINHKAITDAEYKDIEDLLIGAGYTRGDKPYVFLKTVAINGLRAIVQVELLAGEYGGTGKGHRTQRVQGIKAMKMHGCDIAFTMCQTVNIEGILPNGAHDSSTVQIPTMTAFLSMKGIALARRMKLKDAYDIYFCIANCADIASLATEIRTCWDNGLVREGIKIIAEKFASETHAGPAEVAEFDDTADAEGKSIIRQDAYQQVQRLLEKLGLN